MQFLLLLRYDEKPFASEPVRRIIESDKDFEDVRLHSSEDSAIEAVYVNGDEHSIVRLSGGLTSITLSGESAAAQRAALLLQKHLPEPLRITDSDYSFDLNLSKYRSAEELQLAIDKARAEEIT
jgi:hypothetical protein